MSAVLSPATIALAKSVQLFATVEFTHSRRLPIQPLAPRVVWNPIGVFGYIARVVVLDAAGEEVDAWVPNDCVRTFWLQMWDEVIVEFGEPKP